VKRVALVAQPYDSGLRGFRMGTGVDLLLGSGLVGRRSTRALKPRRAESYPASPGPSTAPASDRRNSCTPCSTVDPADSGIFTSVILGALASAPEHAVEALAVASASSPV